MKYSILQSDLSIPPVETLKKAFRSVRFLTDLDAHTLARDAFGVIVKRLSKEQASALHAALGAQGVATEIVQDRLLPRLPQTKRVHRMDCASKALMLYDPLGRSFPLEWRHIMLIAAGTVALQEFKRTEKTVQKMRYTAQGYAIPFTETRYSTRESLADNQILEIVLDRAVLRYNLNAKKFNYEYLGDRRTGDAAEDFSTLVRDLIHFAPRAVINRGAYYIKGKSADTIYYPSKNAFHEEVTWLLWRLQKSQRTQEGEGR